jgi:N-acetylglucosaminyldiphosphoundecaprenol N-acetyl-beta-D-mannosaminyltransferase
MTTERQLLFGHEVDSTTLPDVLARCRDAIAGHVPLNVGDLNAAKVVEARGDSRLRASLLACDLLLPDGHSVVWASRRLGRPLASRIAGIDLFEALLSMAATDGLPVYLLGSTDEVLERLTERASRRWPGLLVAGARNGYFTDAQVDDVVAEVRRSGASLLFLGMPTPKKEHFAALHAPDLGVDVIQGVGGSFDVVAGVLRRAPLAWQRLGMEWAYRLLQEPRRLWRRYLVSNSMFLALTARERVHPTEPYGSRPGPDASRSPSVG